MGQWSNLQKTSNLVCRTIRHSLSLEESFPMKTKISLVSVVVIGLIFVYHKNYLSKDEVVKIEDVVISQHQRLNEDANSPFSDEEIKEIAGNSIKRWQKEKNQTSSESFCEKSYYEAFDNWRSHPQKSLTILKMLRKNYPNWNPRRVVARLAILEETLKD